MTSQQAAEFARAWVAAWNAHDLDAVLSHYTDDFEMSSPFIRSIAGAENGTLKGKDNVRAYWSAALQKMPDLTFELLELYHGAGTICIRYKSVLGLIAVETFQFNEAGRVSRAMAHYDRIPG